MVLRGVLALALALIAGAARAQPAPTAPTAPPAPAPTAPTTPPAPAPAPDAASPSAGPDAEPPAPKPRVRRGIAKPPADMIRENSRLIVLARMAREGASAGRCDVVLELAPKVRAVDPTFHDQLFVVDPMIAACIHPESVPPERRPRVLREVRAEPEASLGRISGELLLGTVVGAGGALIGALIGVGVCDVDCDGWGIGGAYIGAIVTIPLGVRAVGSSGEQTGSFGATFLGATLGGLGGLLMLASGRDNIAYLGMICAPPIGAVIGFNATRRYRPRRVPLGTALVHWTDGDGLALGVPIPVRARAEDRTVTSVPLLGGTF